MCDYEVSVDGKRWRTVSDQAEYDTIHAVAGAILAGADSVLVTKVDDA